MSKFSPASHEWPSNFLFPAHKVPSNGPKLEERQKLAKLIFDIGAQLNVHSHCVCTAVVYMHRFLTIQSLTQYYPLRVCQAAIFLACKYKESIRRAAEVYQCTAKVLKTLPSELPNVINFHESAILDYEDLLLSTLGGRGISVHHLRDCIMEIIEKIQDWTRLLLTKDELTKIACFLAKQSILLTPFCIKYPTDLIAHFCIQLSIEIKIDGIKPTDWMNKRFTSEEIQNLINEFNVIYAKCPDTYKKKFANEEEYKLYKILNKNALSYVDLLEREQYSLGLVKERGSAHPLLLASNTNEQKASAPLSSFSETLPPYRSSDSYQHTEWETSSTNQNSQSLQQPTELNKESEQTDGSTGNKRRYDSTNDDKARKRSSSSLQQGQKM